MKEISKELAVYIRKHSPSTCVHSTVNKHYAEETETVKKLAIQFKRENSKKKGSV